MDISKTPHTPVLSIPPCACVRTSVCVCVCLFVCVCVCVCVCLWVLSFLCVGAGCVGVVSHRSIITIIMNQPRFCRRSSTQEHKNGCHHAASVGRDETQARLGHRVLCPAWYSFMPTAFEPLGDKSRQWVDAYYSFSSVFRPITVVQQDIHQEAVDRTGPFLVSPPGGLRL